MELYEWHGHLALGTLTIEEKLKKLRDAGVVFFRDGGASRAQLENLSGQLQPLKSSSIAGDASGNALDFLLDKKFKVPSGRTRLEAEHGIAGDASVSAAVHAIKDLAAEYGIEYITPVFALYKTGLYGKFLGENFDNPKDFERKIKEIKSLGADFAKVMYSGIASFKQPGTLTCPPLSGREIAEIVNICHGEGLKVMAHCNGADTIKYAVDAETDSIEHGIFIDDTGIKMLADSKTAWTPTVTAITNEELRASHIISVEKASRLGVKLLTGSDCGASTVAFGEGSVPESRLIGNIMSKVSKT